ncbi:MAG: HAD family hydrolase [Lachnospiraceae bacterium]|nr:HAD family hydrolase [Lachnospiraceae bacterium]
MRGRIPVASRKKKNTSKTEKKEYGILFDLDGTLWDSAEGVAESWNEYLDQIPGNTYHMTVERLQSLMGQTMERIAYAFFDRETPERALELLKGCTDYENEYLSLHGGVLYPDLEETLAILHKNYFLAIISNCQEGYIEAFLKYHQLEKYFDDTENYGRTGLEKGDNIRLVVERNHLKKALYVGDIMGDYNSATEAGIPFIHASYGFGTVPEGTPAIRKLSELPEEAKKVFENMK